MEDETVVIAALAELHEVSGSPRRLSPKQNQLEIAMGRLKVDGHFFGLRGSHVARSISDADKTPRGRGVSAQRSKA